MLPKHFKKSYSSYYTQIISVVIIAILLTISYWLYSQGNLVVYLRQLSEVAISLGFLGYILVVFMQFFVSMTGILPASLLAVLAGSIFGLLGGLVVSLSGLILAACCAFLMSRSLLRRWVMAHLKGHNILGKLDDDIERNGWKAVLLLRLAPVSPFGITSYALGLTGVSFKDYLLGTSASAFSLIIYVHVGNVIGEALFSEGVNAQLPGWAEIIFLVLGLVALVLIGVYVKKNLLSR